ncbi:MAG: hypothetical protein LQ350_003476 [Teloschistes chrysophthalmus]|nr:MAG: hypothetical protein LQ350_003476 [Niorma chrysophthalma]
MAAVHPQRSLSQQGDQAVNLLTSQLNDVFEFPVHGSCSQCHHFHVNKALKLPLDLEQHTRVTCDYCAHPILGIGRTSTQTTLASIETTGPQRQSLQRERDAVPESHLQIVNVPVSPPPLRVDTAGSPGNLSTIAEGTSPGGRSSTGHTRPNSGDPTIVNSETHDEVVESQNQEIQEQTARECDGLHPRKARRIFPPASSSTEFQSKQHGNGLRARLRRHAHKTRNYDFPLLGLKFHFGVSGTSATCSATSPPAPDVQETEIREVTENRHMDVAPQIEARDMSNRTTRDLLPTNPLDSSEPIQFPDSGHPDPVLNHPPAPHQKHERIRVLRREATLKRQAELMSKCECRSKCHCRDSSVVSNAASHGQGSSERSIQVPEHHLQHLLSDESSGSSGSQSSSSMRTASLLANLGDHLEPGLMIRTVDRSARANDRLSQASTINGSSISLTSRRPASLRRFNTTPSTLPRHSTDSIRPDLRQILQNSNLPDTNQDSITEPPVSPRGSEDEGEEGVRERSPSSTTQESEIPNHVNESTA